MQRLPCLEPPHDCPVRHNVEIKARVADLAALRARAALLGASGPTLLRQRDTYFRCDSGRLKLRETEGAPGELIWYERPDALEAKTSGYRIAAVDSPLMLRQVLATALGVRVVVEKRRALHLVGPTRIHLDEVVGLGSFLELEAVLGPTFREVEARREVARILAALGVAPEDHVAGSYSDLLERRA